MLELEFNSLYKPKNLNFNEDSYRNELIGYFGYLCRDLNLYDLIDKTNLGKSAIGKEMDSAGRWLFNHRFAGGDLWWKELTNRPVNKWKDVLSHLSSDFLRNRGFLMLLMVQF